MKIFLFFFLMIACTVACKKPGDDLPGTPNPSEPGSITADRSRIFLDYFSRMDTITVQAEGEWTVSVEPYNQDISASKLSSFSNKIVVFDGMEVTDGVDRNATIVIRPLSDSDTAALYIPVTRLAISKDTIVFGGSEDDVFNSILHNGVDQVFAVGYSESSDGDLTANHGGKDFWIMKLDSRGNKLWSKSYGGSQDDVATCIATSYKQDDMTSYTDGYFIAGYTFSNDGDVSGNHGQKDAWLIKIDTSGNLVWQKTLGTTSDDEIVKMTNGAGPGPMISGIKNGDQWLITLERNGDIKWERTFGSSGAEFAGSMVEYFDGYYFTGSGEVPDGDVPDKPTSSYDAWIVKLDKQDGYTQWIRYVAGSGEEKGIDFGGGGIIGTTESSDIFPEFDGKRNIFIAAFEIDGSLPWKKIIRHSSWDEPSAAGYSKFGNSLIVGKSVTPGANVYDQNSFDASILVVNGDGDLVLSKMFGGPGADGLTGIVDAGFRKLVVGYSRGGSASGDLDGYFGWIDYR